MASKKIATNDESRGSLLAAVNAQAGAYTGALQRGEYFRDILKGYNIKDAKGRLDLKAVKALAKATNPDLDTLIVMVNADLARKGQPPIDKDDSDVREELIITLAAAKDKVNGDDPEGKFLAEPDQRRTLAVSEGGVIEKINKDTRGKLFKSGVQGAAASLVGTATQMSNAGALKGTLNLYGGMNNPSQAFQGTGFQADAFRGGFEATLDRGAWVLTAISGGSSMLNGTKNIIQHKKGASAQAPVGSTAPAMRVDGFDKLADTMEQVRIAVQAAK